MVVTEVKNEELQNYTVGGAMKALFDGDPTTNIDMSATVAAIMAGVGLIVAGDAKPEDK